MKLVKVDYNDPRYWIKERFRSTLRVERNEHNQIVVCYTLETEDKRFEDREIPVSEFNEEHIRTLPEYLQGEVRSILPLIPKAAEVTQKMIDRLKTRTVKLTIRYDPELDRDPAEWDWSNLLDMNPSDISVERIED